MHRLSLALAVAALAALPASASAAGNLVVSGDAGHAVDWSTSAPVSLDLVGTKVTTTKILGLAIEDLDAHTVRSVTFDGPDLKVTVQGPATPPQPNSEAPPASTSDTVDLAPGHYRLRLFGQGAGAVTVPVTDGSGGSLQATAPSAAQFVWSQPSALPGATVVSDAIPLSLAQGGLGINLLQEHTNVYAADAQSICVRKADDNCANAMWAWNGGSAGPAVGDGWIRFAGTIANEFYAPGDWVADAKWVTAGADNRFDRVLVVVNPS